MATEIIELESAEPDATLADQRYHWGLLIPSAIVIGLSILLTVPNESQVAVPLLNIPLPDVCSFKRLWGLDCPGCGLTRCFISLGHGRLDRALHFNPVGVGFFLIVAGQIPYRLMQIIRLRRGLPEWRIDWFGYSLLMFFAVGLIIQWIVKLMIGGWA